MTIVLTMGNVDQIIQVSDRRLMSDGHLVEDEFSKGGVFVSSNARLAFGFTGLARYGDFNTHRWLLENLVKLGPPDFEAKNILDRLTEKATEDFAKLPALSKVPIQHKRLSIMFSGYLYHHSPPMIGAAVLTNFQDFNTGIDNNTAWDSFKCMFCNEKKPRIENPTLVQRIGVWQAMNPADEAALRTLLIKRKPASVIVSQAVRIIRNMADRPQAAGSIGKQLSSLVLPRDLDAGPISGYHTMVAKRVIYLTPMAITTETMQVAMGDPELKLADEADGSPLALPEVGRNQPCPCGSGKKYKRCHGYTRR